MAFHQDSSHWVTSPKSQKTCMYMCMHACVYVDLCVWVHACVYVCMHLRSCIYMHVCMCVHACVYIVWSLRKPFSSKMEKKRLVSLDWCIYLSTGLTTSQSPKQFLLNDSHKKLVVCYVHHVFWLCNLTLSLWLHCVRHSLQSWNERLLEFLFLYVVFLILYNPMAVL